VVEVQQRSTFVTVVAWIFIALSGLSTVISILQNIMVWTLFRSPEVSHAMQAPRPPGVPPIAAFMTTHFHLFFLAFLLVSAFTLASSIGLLKRWNWARLCFVGMMVLGIVWNLGGLALQFSMFSSMQEQFSTIPMQDGPDMQSFLIAMAIVGVLFAIGFSALYGWIAKRLLSPQIAEEFRR
jgi:hypothetical protein